MDNKGGFGFIALHFDGDGKPRSIEAQQSLIRHVEDQRLTDVLLIAHGFRNNEQEASALYDEFLTNFHADVKNAAFVETLGTRRFAVGGIYWPSKAFREAGDQKGGAGGVQRAAGGTDADEELAAAREQLKHIGDQLVDPGRRGDVNKALAMLGQLEGDSEKQNEFVTLVLSLVDEAEPDPTEGLDDVKAQEGANLLAKLDTPILLPTSRDDGDGGVTSVGGIGSGSDGDGGVQFIGGYFKSVAGKVGQFLNMTTWYMMKNRSGTVGREGVAPFVRALKATHPTVRVHLVGHSLGGRCMAACSKALAFQSMVQPDSVSLLQAAFSHYGFSDNNGRGRIGFFRDVLGPPAVVKGPLISTFSYQDTVVGTAYAISSRLAGDNIKKIGNKDDQYGGIGRNGAQRTPEAETFRLHEPGRAYSFAANKVYNLDGSGGGIKDHGDVKNPRVTWAVASAVART